MLNLNRQNLNSLTSRLSPAITRVRGSRNTRSALWAVGLTGLAYGLFRLYQYRSEQVTSNRLDTWAEQLEKKLGGPEKSERKPTGPILDRAGDRGTNDIKSA